MAGGLESKAIYLEDEDLPVRSVTLPDGLRVMTVSVPNVNSTVIFSYSHEQVVPSGVSGERPLPQAYWRVGVFIGPVPKDSGSSREDFYKRAEEIARSGKVIPAEAVKGRVEQLIRDEQMYARYNPHR
jgi:hypothetical protein